MAVAQPFTQRGRSAPISLEKQPPPVALMGQSNDPSADPLKPPAHPERIAWAVIWAAFGAFCLLTLAGLFSLREYLTTAVDSQSARASSIAGTLLVRSPRQSQWASVTPDTALSDGYRVRTDGVSQGFLTLFDYSTVQVFSNSELQINQLGAVRYNGPRKLVDLSLLQGKAHIGVAPSTDEAKQVVVKTPHGVFELQEGAYTITVFPSVTQLRVSERGQAQATAKGGGAHLLQQDQRIELTAQGATSPKRASEELVYNGDFLQGLNGWQPGNITGFREGADLVGTQARVFDEGRVAVRFQRLGSKGTHNETYLFQELDKDVSDFKELWLALDMRIRQQSLSGGGYLGSEYPVIVRVNYRTVTGSEGSAVYGFYYQNDDRNRTDFGTQVPPDTWTAFTAPNNLMALNPPPQRVLSIQVGASGWDYDSLVAGVSLSGQ